MKEKLLDPMKEKNLKDIIDDINTRVEVKFEIIEGDDLEKWTSLPILLLEEENVQDHIIKFIEYVDGLLIPLDKKIEYVITLSSLMKFGKLDICNIEDGSIFMLTDYFKDKKNSTIEEELPVLNNSIIINLVRTKSIENDFRTELLSYIYKTYIDKKTEKNDKETVIKEIIASLEKLDCYQIQSLMEK